MRWASAYLCGVGDKWGGGWYLGRLRPAEYLSSFYSFEMNSFRWYLRRVTIDLEEEGCAAMLHLAEQQEKQGADTGQVAAYGYNESKTFQVRRFESYNFESESLRSSYPALEANNREKAVAGLADSVIMAKCLGVEKLSMMRRYFERYRLPTNVIWQKAMQLFLEQCVKTAKDDSPLHQMFIFLENVPLPYELQMVSLWDECRNWRLLQASAHCDIDAQLFPGLVKPECLFEMEPLPNNIFKYSRRFALTKIRNLRFLGVSMETVRTFLGEWVLSAPDVVDWEPSIPTNSFEFSTSFRFTSGDKTRIIWECQRGLQRELAEKSTAHANMSSSSELIMLFILSMPSLRVEEEVVEEENGNVNNETGVVSGGENNDSAVSRAHSSVNVSMRGYHVYSPLAPQDISVVVICSTETRRASVRLRHNRADGQFNWEVWVNSSMGCMKGLYEWRKVYGNVVNIECAFRKVDLRKPVVELSPLHYDVDSSMETGIVRVWTGWAAWDARICKFEIDQWLMACNIDIDNIEVDQFGRNRKIEKEIDRAEKTIRKVR